MINTLQPTQTPAWASGVLTPAQEFGPVSLEALSGEIPSGLRGSLYRNGPAQLERSGLRVGHWFDGDGGILGVHFTDVGAVGLYRYIQTQGFQEEAKAGHYIFANYGMLPPGPLWTRFNKDVKNVANTSVLALPDKLLALWEGGMPHALDLKTLETIGLEDLNGLQGRNFSAHPKCDSQTGDIYNFGVVIGRQTTLNLYRSDATGTLRQQNSIPINGLPLIHDCAIAGRYLVFCIPPVRIQVLPVLARLKSFSDAMEWQPELGTEILVIDRDTLEAVSRTTTVPWYQWHFGNGYELPDGSISITMARYPDFQTNQRLKEVATGTIQTFAKATLWQLRLAPQSGKVLEMQEILSQSCEFPISHPHEVGQPSRYTYLTVHRTTTDIQTEVYDAIARFDHHTGTLTQANLGDRSYVNEPIYAPDATNPAQGWILVVLYNSRQNRSELWIFDSRRLEDEPMCRLALPAIVPISFHGTWKAA
ncbi:MAG: carotenoid oxygenase family protein [Oscillatoriales cyanobacterium C42_A2020_001]|nr:carotenoid oxygenase family protein [Leptolyngbyaceae cyanobacterium C42_A2020_001]